MLEQFRVVNFNKKQRIMNGINKFTIECVSTVPFGYEEYNENIVLNLEIKTDEKEGKEYFDTIKSIEKLIEKKEIDYKLPVNCKYFITGLKMRTDDTYHHRCYIRDNKIKFENIVNKQIIAKLELDYIWINRDTYGLTWFINDVIIK